MNVDSAFLLSVTLKLSLLIAGSLLLVLLLWKGEPRWRVLVLRAVLFALPVAVVAGLLAPTFQLPMVSLPVSIVGESSSGNAQVLPKVLVPSAEVMSGSEGREMAAPALVDTEPGFSWVIWQTGIGVWVLGGLVLLVREGFLKQKVRRELQKAELGDPFLQDEWRAVCVELGAESVPVLKVGASKSSPFLIGGKTPQLLVPESLVADESVRLRRHVFRHEAAHLAAKDLAWLSAMRLLTRVLWLHPLFWLLEAKHLQACEEAADAEAARRGGTQQYRGALASLALELMPTGRALPATAFLRGPSIVRRLRAVVHHGEMRPPSRGPSLALVTAIVMVAAALGNVGLAQRGGGSRIDLKMSELSYEGYQDSLEKGETEQACEYLKMAIEYLQKGNPVDKRRTEWSRELDRLTLKNSWKPDPEKGAAPDNLLDAVFKTLRETIIPTVDLRDVPMERAIQALYQQAAELNADEKLPFRFEFDVNEEAKAIALTLKLRNVPMIEALRYITSLAEVRFEIEESSAGNVVRIVPLVAADEPLSTTVFDVVGIQEFEQDGADARQILENVGVTFPKGSSTLLLAERSQLIVRNTKSQLRLVEYWLDVKNRTIDPSDIWFRGYTQMKEGDALAELGKLPEALSKYEGAKQLFDLVHETHRDFHSEIVRFRQNRLQEMITELRRQLGRRGTTIVDQPPHLLPNHPIKLPQRDARDENDLGSLLPAVPLQSAEAIGASKNQLAPSLLQIQKAECEARVAEDGSRLQTLTIQVAARSRNVQASKMSLVVRFYDRVDPEKLEIGAGETEFRFPTIPYDWADRAESETVEVHYQLPKAEVANGHRRFFGYVAELYYDGLLQEVTASPSKLLKMVE